MASPSKRLHVHLPEHLPGISASRQSREIPVNRAVCSANEANAATFICTFLIDDAFLTSKLADERRCYEKLEAAEAICRHLAVHADDDDTALAMARTADEIREIIQLSMDQGLFGAKADNDAN